MYVNQVQWLELPESAREPLMWACLEAGLRGSSNWHLPEDLSPFKDEWLVQAIGYYRGSGDYPQPLQAWIRGYIERWVDRALEARLAGGVFSARQLGVLSQYPMSDWWNNHSVKYLKVNYSPILGWQTPAFSLGPVGELEYDLCNQRVQKWIRWWLGQDLSKSPRLADVVETIRKTLLTMARESQWYVQQKYAAMQILGQVICPWCGQVDESQQPTGERPEPCPSCWVDIEAQLAEDSSLY